MEDEVQKEHEWLQKFLGEWRSEGEGDMGPDQPPMTFQGTESVRAIGGFWIQAEGRGPMPDGSPALTQLMLGFDARKQRYIGTWLGSMMSHLWIYEGRVDASGKILTLDTVGPDMSGGDKLSRYQDIHEFVDEDHRILSSQMLGDDGQWRKFVTVHYRRQR